MTTKKFTHMILMKIDFVDEDAVNEDVETEDDVDLGEGDDLLKDEVEDL